MDRETTQSGALTKADLDAVRDRERIGELFSDLAGSAWVVLELLHKMIGDDDFEGAAGAAAMVASMGALADRSAEIFGEPNVVGGAEAWTFSPRAIKSLGALRGVLTPDGGAA